MSAYFLHILKPPKFILIFFYSTAHEFLIVYATIVHAWNRQVTVYCNYKI